MRGWACGGCSSSATRAPSKAPWARSWWPTLAPRASSGRLDTVDTKATTTGARWPRSCRGADAVFFSGGPGPGPVKLWQQLYGADPGLSCWITAPWPTPSSPASSGRGAQRVHDDSHPSARGSIRRLPALVSRLSPGLRHAAPARDALRLRGHGGGSVHPAGRRQRRRPPSGGGPVLQRPRRLRARSLLGPARRRQHPVRLAVDRVVGGRPVFDQFIRGTPAPRGCVRAVGGAAGLCLLCGCGCCAVGVAVRLGLLCGLLPWPVEQVRAAIF